MNKVLFICILMIGYLSGQAQAIKTSDVPSVVTGALKKEYPYATNIKWEMEDGMYEASFLNNKAEMAVVYSDKGVLALTETQIEIAALPASVREYFAKNMMNTSISEASKIVDSQGIVSYEVEVDKTDYLFTGNGQFLRKQFDNEEDDDKE
jgi:hypothetical protein